MTDGRFVARASVGSVSTALFWITITIGALSGGSGLACRGRSRKGPVDSPVGEDRPG